MGPVDDDCLVGPVDDDCLAGPVDDDCLVGPVVWISGSRSTNKPPSRRGSAGSSSSPENIKLGKNQKVLKRECSRIFQNFKEDSAELAGT